MVVPQEWTDKEEPFLKTRRQSESTTASMDKDSNYSTTTTEYSTSTANAKTGNGTFCSSVFMLCQSALGAGILTLPYCFLVAGIVPATTSLFFFACVTALSSTAIVACQEASNSSDYQSIVKQYLGQSAGYVVSAIIAAYCLLNCVGALVIVADNIGPVLIHLVGNQDVWWLQRNTHILAGGLLAFPMLCFREITSLRFTAFLSLAATVFIVCCVVHRMLLFPSSEEESLYGPVELVVPSWSMCLALPSICLSFQNQMQVPAIYAELHTKLKSVRTMSLAIMTSWCIVLPLYMLMGYAGYELFRSATTPDILDGPFDGSATSIFVARLLLASNAILGVPVNHYPARSALYALWQRISSKRKDLLESEVVQDHTRKGSKRKGSKELLPSLGHTMDERTMDEPSPCFFYVEVVTYLVFMVILAMVLTSLDVVLDIMSATCAMAVMFILPGLFFLTGERLPQATYRWQVCACAFIVIGTAMAIVSAGDVVSKLS